MNPPPSIVLHGAGPVTFPEYLSLFGLHLVGVVGVGLLVYWLVAVGRNHWVRRSP
jgi:hypothetical protein